MSQQSFCMGKWPKLCNVCGIRGPSHCSKCKKSYYCSRKHQILDWQKGHKENCVQLQVQAAGSFPVPSVTNAHIYYINLNNEYVLMLFFPFTGR